MQKLQQQYIGFLNTPLLAPSLIGIKQIIPKSIVHKKCNFEIKEKLRLGKLVERFVSHQLSCQNNIKIIAENIQIQNGKITIGEMDCLLFEDEKATHVEIVYKFYLQDKNLSNNNIEQWIGPNREDSLTEKLIKLQNKQFPLLYRSVTNKYLEIHKLKKTDFIQKLYFKAQLFVSYEDFGTEIEFLNNDCVYGFYINKSEIGIFKESKFYIPRKEDWLIEVHPNVNWLSYSEFNKIINSENYEKRSPLCWIKNNKGIIYKIFVTFW